MIYGLIARMTEQFTGQENYPNGLSLDALLRYLQRDDAEIDDPLLLSQVPDIFSPEGVQTYNTLPQSQSGNVHRAGFDMSWDDVKAGDIVRGRFFISSVSSMEEALSGEEMIALRIASTNYDRNFCTPGPMHVRLPRSQFADTINALRKLTGHHLLMDVVAQADITHYLDIAAEEMPATPLRVVALDQPFHPAQLPYIEELQFARPTVLLAGTVRSLTQKNEGIWLELTLPDGSVQTIRASTDIHYQKTVDGLPIPVVPQIGDFVHINANCSPWASGAGNDWRFACRNIYRIKAPPGSEITEMLQAQRQAEILGSIADMHSESSYPAFRSLLAELVRMRPGSEVVDKAREKYEQVFANTPFAEAPAALVCSGTSYESFAALGTAFNVDTSAMNVQEFKAFSLAVMRGEVVVQAKVLDDIELAYELHAIDGHNPGLILEGLQTIMPAVAGDNLQPTPLQIQLLTYAISYIPVAFAAVEAANMLSNALRLYDQVDKTGSIAAKHAFAQLKEDLTLALREGIKACAENPLELRTPEQQQALQIYTALRDRNL